MSCPSTFRFATLYTFAASSLAQMASLPCRPTPEQKVSVIIEIYHSPHFTFDIKSRLVLWGDVFPSSQKDLSLHFPVVCEKRFHRDGGGEVKHFLIVFDRDLKSVQRLHLLNGAAENKREGIRRRLVRRERRDLQRSRCSQAKRVLVELNAKLGHGGHRLCKDMFIHMSRF